MNEKTLLIEGYQPTVKVQDGYQPKASEQNTSVATPIAKLNIIPPKGGTGEVKSNKK